MVSRSARNAMLACFRQLEFGNGFLLETGDPGARKTLKGSLDRRIRL
jgi:hypothetical protein